MNVIHDGRVVIRANESMTLPLKAKGKDEFFIHTHNHQLLQT